MNNQPSAEDLLKRAMDLLNDKDVLFNDAGLLHDLSMLENDVIAFNLASIEVSAAVTPLSWTEAKMKIAASKGFSEWENVVTYKAWTLPTDEYILAMDRVFEEAAQVFISSNRDAKLANFIENHATQIIPGK